MEALYTATATAQGGRNGKVTSSDGILNLDVRMPKGLGGSGEEATNPEQLFAAGYSACFDSALNLVARQQKAKVETKVTTHVSIGKDTDGGFALSANMEVSITGVEQAEAEKLVEMAHQVCPYSKATRGNMDVTFDVSAS
ncbi:organic hydroperoxide resistance protein [Mechercharimyces sp. CAU 1602]|uniref:organic hydroperoxide resistance protein n=1 Tax=Mechercharimyces sp. CAU 1602 TaxID=2973933 RepID=UPI0021628707|nr:organic hydroperoxide resistance protein [Mechercharimyces sp. CAU 1602]MCS1351048.1 organic hydroperoxide resistance protein [Mechercharimyces sp. CAU 1602]